MTVAELINKLQQLDPTLIVVVSEFTGNGSTLEVTIVDTTDEPGKVLII
jgi:hypothetical protein